MARTDQQSPYEIARNWAAEWSQRWFLGSSDMDRMRLGTIDAGWATHVEAYYILHRFALSRLDGGHASRSSVSSTLKRAGHDRALRHALLRATARRPGYVKARSAKSMVLLEIPTPSMTEGPIAVAKSLGHQAITAVGDPRVYDRLMHHEVAGLPLLTSWREERRAVTEARAQAAAAFEAVIHDPPAMELMGIDVTDAALNALRRLALRSIPWLAPERDAIAAAIGAVQPRTLVMASDQHRLGRLATALAGERGLETVVVQHGLPQTRIGMIPVVAGCLAVWSRDSYEWFVREGTPRAKLCVTGDPRMEMHRAVANRVQRSILLLALSPTDDAVNRAVLRLALGMRLVWPQAPRLVVKLHPGHRDWKWVSEEVGAQHGVSVLHREPLEPLLQEAVATVVLRSTVALEALAIGSPIIGVRVPGGVSTADHELKSMRIPVAASPQELCSIVQSMLEEQDRHNYFKERSAEITSLLGEIEGAAARVAALARGAGCSGTSAQAM